MGNSSDMIDVEVAYALPTEQSLLLIKVPEGTEIKEVIIQSKILQEHPELELDKLDVESLEKYLK